MKDAIGVAALCEKPADIPVTTPVSVASASKWQDVRSVMSLNRRLLVLTALAAALAPAEALARRGRGRGGDHDEARDALEHGEALPLAEILPLALRAVPGEILEIELEREHGRLVYEIELLARTGRVRKVILDARTGAVLGVEDER